MKIVVTSPSFSKNEILKSKLHACFPNAILNDCGRRLEENELVAFIKDADGVIIGLENMDKKVIDQLPNLKIISKYGVGLDNVDSGYCKEKGIKVGWTPGVNKQSVAEMTVAFMIMLCRNLFFTGCQLKEGTWNKNGGFNLTKKVIGIIGMGNIGKEVVRLLKPFNCTILVNDIIEQNEYYKKNQLVENSKEDIYKKSDVITLHTPLTDKTKNMINKRTIAMMKKSAFLINTARGLIVNTDDLKWALSNNVISGAAIDVYDKEPPEDKELLDLPNLICTPHIGGNSHESVVAMGTSAINHLKEFFLI